MKEVACIAFLSFWFFLAGMASAGEFTLPVWDEDVLEENRGKRLGGGLWPPLLYPLDILEGEGGDVQEASELLVEKTEKLVEKDSRIPVIEPKVEPVFNVLTKESWASLFGEGCPENYLNDPQEIFSDTRRRGMVRFLDYLRNDSRFPVYVLVLDKSQRLPEGVSLESLYAKWFPEGESLLVAYFYGNAGNVRFHMKSPVLDALPVGTLGQIRSHAVDEALVVDEPADQFERLCIDLSVRLHRLELRYAALLDEETNKVAHGNVSKRVALFKGVSPKVLGLGIGLAVVLAFIGVYVQWYRSKKVYSFPIQQVYPRYSAPFCAGTCGVMDFSDPIHNPED